jgi:rhamnose utilization protein RhaD (predicted bifunctional aldolase and dehydrogenase)
MPHKIVAHLHVVEALAILVLKDSERVIKDLVDTSLKWAHVDYFKPGPELAIAVRQAINSNPEIDILFLKNHGIVVGGATVEDVEVRIEATIAKLKRGFLVSSSPISSVLDSKEIPEAYRDIYFFIEDPEVQSLALDSRFLDRIINDWALYPDQVVFLGPKAYIYENWNEFLSCVDVEALPELIFIKNIGVFARKSFGKAGHAQILNYFDVISRLNDKAIASSLSEVQIHELLDWDAEKYRLGLLKK